MNAQEVIRLFKALGDTTRFAIVEILHKGPQSVGDLVVKLNKSQPAVSIALQKLSQAHIVMADRQGTTVLYSLQEPEIRQLLKAAGVVK